MYLITDTAKLREDKLLRADGIRRIIKTNMQALANMPYKLWATLIGSTTDRYHIIPRL